MTARSPNTLTTSKQLIPAEAQKAVEETEEATKEADRAIGEATFQSDLFLLRTMDLYSQCITSKSEYQSHVQRIRWVELTVILERPGRSSMFLGCTFSILHEREGMYISEL